MINKPNSKDCNQLCSNGNPNRGYLCRCSKCQGAQHGSTKITFDFLEEVVDRKLMDPTLKLADWQRWHALMQTLLAHKPRGRKAA